MSLENLPVEVRANGIRRRREALGLTVAQVAIETGVLAFAVSKAEQGRESSRTYRLLEDWLDEAERQKAATTARRVPFDDTDQDGQAVLPPLGGPPSPRTRTPREGVSGECEFEITMDGVTVTARGPADKIGAMGAIVRDAMEVLKRERGTTPPAPRTREA